MLSAGVLRSWSRAFEKNLNWSADLTVPLKFKLGKIEVDNRIKTGYAGWRKDRLFWVANIGESNFASGTYEPLSNTFDPATHPEGKIDISDFADQYKAVADLHAGYLMLDTRIGDHIRLAGGLRGEYIDLNRTNTLIERFIEGQGKAGDQTDYSAIYGKEPAFNWFPSASFTYSINKQMNLRLAYAKSIVRPDLRELAYFKEYDFELGGNYWSTSIIRSTRIHNFDIRYEWYTGPGEVISLSAFYKKLSYPMEIFAEDNRIFQLINSRSAKNKGLEAEFRKSFAFTGVPVLKNITLAGNFTRLFAKVTPMQQIYVMDGNKLQINEKLLPEVDRPQAGASNYTYNASLLYDTKRISFTGSFNYLSNRVVLAGTNSTLTQFESPLPSLDGQLAYHLLNGKADIRLNVSNVLNRVSRVYSKRNITDTDLLYQKGDPIKYESAPGRTYGLSFNYKF